MGMSLVGLGMPPPPYRALRVGPMKVTSHAHSKHHASNALCPPPPPLGEGCYTPSSNHLYPLVGGGDCPFSMHQNQNVLGGFPVVAGGFWPLVAPGREQVTKPTTQARPHMHMQQSSVVPVPSMIDQ